jgi:hypothetical protein
VTPFEDALRLVRRARRRLEAVRLLKAASRGALAGAAAGILSLLVTPAPALPWALLGAGALAGLGAALVGNRIGTAAAALYLDRRLGTLERFTTVATLPPGPLTIRVAQEIPPQRRLPRSPVPREAALVPLAVFLLFAASLLPRARAGEPPPATRLVAVPAPAEDGASEVDAATLERLARGERLKPEDALALREAIQRDVRRPEDRRAAEMALSRAAGGEGAAGAEVLDALRPAAADRQEGRLLASAYPDAEEFVRAYRRALEEDGQ